jgi:hypothetical protein
MDAVWEIIMKVKHFKSLNGIIGKLDNVARVYFVILVQFVVLCTGVSWWWFNMEDSDNIVRLRGLPWAAKVDEVIKFLGGY